MTLPSALTAVLRTHDLYLSDVTRVNRSDDVFRAQCSTSALARIFDPPWRQRSSALSRRDLARSEVAASCNCVAHPHPQPG
jgi:hypothetical protein